MINLDKGSSHAIENVDQKCFMQEGSVGLILSQDEPPFHVEGGEGLLMDEQGVLQGHKGYMNQAVALHDRLVAVDGYHVNELELASPRSLESVLQGPRTSIVQLTFERPSTQRAFSIRVQRHAIKQPGSDLYTAAGGDTPCGVGIVIGRPDDCALDYPVIVLAITAGGSAHRSSQVQVGDVSSIQTHVRLRKVRRGAAS